MNNIPQNARINLHAFGMATVRRLYTLERPRELVVDVRADSGQLMHLSIAYVNKLLAEQK